MATDSDRKWWRMTAGRKGVLAQDWYDGPDGEDSRETGVVSVGWGGSIGDFRELSDDEIKAGDDKAGAGGQVARFLNARSDGMEEGDIVIAYAPKPVKMVIGVGIVGKPRYVENPDLVFADHKYQRTVDWFDWGTPVDADELDSDAPTVYTPSTLVRFKEDPSALQEAIESAEETDIGSALRIDEEAQMQQWVVNHHKEVDALDITVEEREYSSRVGDADILARDESGLVVIELKRGEAGDSAVGQVQRYMGAIREEYPDKDVRGIIIAEEFSEGTRLAARSGDIQLLRFHLSAKIEPAD